MTRLPGSIEETSLYSDTMIEYLKTYREDMPQWLKDYKSGDMDTMKSEGWSGEKRIYFLVENILRWRLPDDTQRIGTIGRTLTIFSSSLNATKIVTTVGERNDLPWPSS